MLIHTDASNRLDQPDLKPKTRNVSQARHPVNYSTGAYPKPVADMLGFAHL
jgi:hypothetical protein